MMRWLQRLAGAILGRVPDKAGRVDTATRLMFEADFRTHDIKPVDRNRYNAKSDVDPLEELRRLVSSDDPSSQVPPSIPGNSHSLRPTYFPRRKPSRR